MSGVSSPVHRQGLLTVPSCGGRGERAHWGLLFIRTPILFEGSTLRASQRPDLIPSSWGVSFNIEIGVWGRNTNIQTVADIMHAYRMGRPWGGSPLKSMQRT